MTRLAQIKPDILKIDRSLVADCDKDATLYTILRHAIKLCGDLNIKVVLEGIERQEEAEALRGLGVRFMQGYYFSKPRFQALATDDDIRMPIRRIRVRKRATGARA